MTGEELRFVAVAQGDALAGPLLAELAAEYSQRYGGTEEAQLRSLRDHPADDFAPPWGGLFIGVGADGTPLTGGAFRRFGDVDGQLTAELKRIWTSRGARRRGLATATMARLEAEIAHRGYRRIYLMTGDRQPEAEGLYTSLGYQRLPAPLAGRGPVYPVAFAKVLTPEVSA